MEQNNILTEKEKDSKEYLIEKVKECIGSLVYNKDHLIKAYNYYHGIRDKDQYKYLEDTFGIDVSTSITMVPLIRRHVNFLVGKLLTQKINTIISCTDKTSLEEIKQEKDNATKNFDRNALKNTLLRNIKKSQGNLQETDLLEDLELSRENFNKTFRSNYEKAAQAILKIIKESPDINLNLVREQLFTHLLITGSCYYRTKVYHKGELPEIEVLNPYNVFVERNFNSTQVNEYHKAVVRKRLPVYEVLQKYGHLLTKQEKETLGDDSESGLAQQAYWYPGDGSGLISNYVDGIEPNIDPFYNNSQNKQKLITVYEVEWLDSNPVKENGKIIGHRVDRYTGVQIGSDIYVNLGVDEQAFRSSSKPYKCTLSINGMNYADTNGKPYSLVLACANLQD